MKLCANAKLNLFLRVRGVLADGYHELTTVMHPISLHDDVIVEPAETLSVRSNDRSLPDGSRNTAYRAAELYGRPVDIRITKRIPTGAGLGGGSSDAAAVLRALDELYGEHSERELVQIALRVGADVPFSLYSKTALCKNKGEVLTPAPCGQKLWFVVAMGERSLLTGAVFAEHDRIAKVRDEDELGILGISISNFVKTEKFLAEEQAMLLALSSGNVRGIANAMRNDLEEAAVSLLPEVLETRMRISDSGAVRALMSGSGSACFGIYEDEDKARRGCEKLANLPFARVCCSEL